MKNKLKAITLSALAIGLIVGGAGIALANSEDGFAPLAQRFAERSGINQEDSPHFSQEAWNEHSPEMGNRFENKLTMIVENGDLTEDQKNLILDKQRELRAERGADQEEWQNFSQEGSYGLMQEHRAEMQEWAEHNGIDPEYLPGQKAHGGFGLGRGR